MDIGFIIRSVFIQVIVFSLIPFIVWYIKARNKESFFSYVGIKIPKREKAVKEILLFILIYIIVYASIHFTSIADITQSSAEKYRGLGSVAILPAFLASFFQQALAEEILFRGFIADKLIQRLGMVKGNLLQATIFGLSHVLFAISDTTELWKVVVIAVAPGLGGGLLGYLDQKLYRKSMLPSILLHGLGNFIMIMSVAF